MFCFSLASVRLHLSLHRSSHRFPFSSLSSSPCASLLSASSILTSASSFTSSFSSIACRQPVTRGDDDNNDDDDKNDANINNRARVKRRVAITLAYLGTYFRGNVKTFVGPYVPLDLHSIIHSKEVPLQRTVEAELELALHKCGFISTPNYGDLAKIGASRSSRTDKGVHSLGTVFTAKLMLEKDKEHDLNYMTSLINALLPSDVTVIHCHRVPRSFDPRRQCTFRSYKYYLPAEYFTVPVNHVQHTNNNENKDDSSDSIGSNSSSNSSSSSSSDSMISSRSNSSISSRSNSRSTISDAALNDICRVFIGHHCFKNYTTGLEKANRRAVKYQQNLSVNVLKQDQTARGDQRLQRKKNEKEEKEEKEEKCSVDGDDDVVGDDDVIVEPERDDEEEQLNRRVNSRLRQAQQRHIIDFSMKRVTMHAQQAKFSSSFDLINSDGNTPKLPSPATVQTLEFSVVGSSFVYHQIRYMVGCVTAIAHGVWPCRASFVRATLTESEWEVDREEEQGESGSNRPPLMPGYCLVLDQYGEDNYPVLPKYKNSTVTTKMQTAANNGSTDSFSVQSMLPLPSHARAALSTFLSSTILPHIAHIHHNTAEGRLQIEKFRNNLQTLKRQE